MFYCGAGYVGYGEETLSYGKEQEESRENESGKKSGETKVSAPDLKENFSMGPYNPASGLPAPRLPDNPEGFKEAWMDYYKVRKTPYLIFRLNFVGEITRS